MGTVRRALLWRAFVPALFLIAGCRPSPEPGVSFWHAMGGPLGDALDRIVQQFNESSPGEPILSVRMGNYGTLSQKIMGAVAAHTPPVMGQVYESWTAELLEADRIVPFQEFIHLIPDSVLQDKNYGKKFKVTRGGSIHKRKHGFLKQFAMLPYRNISPPEMRFWDTGFRCAKSV